MGLERSTRRLSYTADELGRPLNLRSQGGKSQKPKPSATVNLVKLMSVFPRQLAKHVGLGAPLEQSQRFPRHAFAEQAGRRRVVVLADAAALPLITSLTMLFGSFPASACNCAYVKVNSGTVPIAGLYMNLKTAIGKTLNNFVNAGLMPSSPCAVPDRRGRSSLRTCCRRSSSRPCPP